MSAKPSEIVHGWRQRVNALGQDEVVCWLRDVLRGHIVLPQGTPDESRGTTLLNIEGTLPGRVRDDLRDAGLALLSPLLAYGAADDTYAAALLAVCHRLQPSELSARLAAYTQDVRWLLRQPERQQHVFAGLLFDLRVNVGPSFWATLGERKPAQLGLLSLSALLRTNASQAWHLVERLPEEDPVADLLYVVVMGELETRTESERNALQRDWSSASALASSLHSAVDEAFAQFLSSPLAAVPLAAVLSRRSMTARLTPAPQREAA